MTPRPRFTPGGVRLALVRLLLVLATVLLPYGTAVAYGPEPVVAHDPEPVPSDSASASASPEPSRAGTLAGEGRLRPGRPQGPAAAVEGQDEDEPGEQTATESEETGDESPAATSAQPPREAGLVPTASQPHPTHQAAAHSQEDASEPVLHILPLGSGLVLIGLGFGLAFIALRLRRS
ncbi:hypothetical protein ABZ357_22390 [Streptomyces sp. NPDC005917]|uniref:hypothetical protein n=1 Tax=unclassified Streptomyces TaxID=2593676 RepID=UPI0033EC1CD6